MAIEPKDATLRTKSCKECKEELPEDRFYLVTNYKNDKTYPVRKPRCSKCHNQWKQTKPAFRITQRMGQYRFRAKKRGVGFDLDRDFVERAFKSPCTYCGKSGCPMSIDRIRHDGGYTKDNCVPACERCNRIKSDLSEAAWLHILPAIQSAVKEGLI